jgi:hypothetical protein
VARGGRPTGLKSVGDGARDLTILNSTSKSGRPPGDVSCNFLKALSCLNSVVNDSMSTICGPSAFFEKESALLVHQFVR